MAESVNIAERQVPLDMDNLPRDMYLPPDIFDQAPLDDGYGILDDWFIRNLSDMVQNQAIAKHMSSNDALETSLPSDDSGKEKVFKNLLKENVDLISGALSGYIDCILDFPDSDKELAVAKRILDEMELNREADVIKALFDKASRIDYSAETIEGIVE